MSDVTQQDVKRDAKADRKTTEYVVLEQAPDGSWYQTPKDGRINAVSAPEAMKAAARHSDPVAEGGSGTGVFVAVPARSWKPMSRKVEQVTKESWSS